jgi:hypothetical protein
VELPVDDAVVPITAVGEDKERCENDDETAEETAEDDERPLDEEATMPLDEAAPVDDDEANGDCVGPVEDQDEDKDEDELTAAVEDSNTGVGTHAMSGVSCEVLYSATVSCPYGPQLPLVQYTVRE